MVVKQSAKGKPVKAVSKTKLSGVESVAQDSVKSSTKKVSNSSKGKHSVAGWIQDASLETSSVSFGFEAKPGEREMEFSVAMRRRQEGGQLFAELRGRALVHARGNVLALAEASYVAEMSEGDEEARLVVGMYPSLRDVLQSLLEMAGHTPPLPESIESAA